MRPTRLARGLLALAGALLLAAFFALAVTPAVLALALLAWLLHTRWDAARAFRASTPRFARQVLEPVLHEGAPFHVSLDATGSTLPDGVRMAFEDRLPPDVRAALGSSGEGATTLRYAALASAKGNRRFVEVRATLRDRLGLWESARHVPLVTSLQILSSLDALHAGRTLARREPLEASARSPVGLLVRDLEFESIREFSPGDRLRDVDWKRVALHKRLLTKTWEREMEATVVLLVDAGRTMRARHGDVSKLDHAALLTLEVAEAAAERNYRLGYVAFDEVGVVDELVPTREKGAARRLAERLSDLPGRILAQRRLDVGLPGQTPVDEEELGFLSILAGLRGARPSHGGTPQVRAGIQAATARILASAGEQRVFLIAFTDLERVPTPTIQALARVAGAGHRVSAVILPGSLFLRGAPPSRVRDVENAYRQEETRRRGRAALLAGGVRVLELGPESNAAPILRASQQKGLSRRSSR